MKYGDGPVKNLLPEIRQLQYAEDYSKIFYSRSCMPRLMVHCTKWELTKFKIKWWIHRFTQKILRKSPPILNADLKFKNGNKIMKVPSKMEISGTLEHIYLAPEFKELIWPTYPRWEKKCIKRKYGKHPAIYLDVWVPFAPSLFDLIPKVPLERNDWRLRKSAHPDLI